MHSAIHPYRRADVARRRSLARALPPDAPAPDDAPTLRLPRPADTRSILPADSRCATDGPVTEPERTAPHEAALLARIAANDREAFRALYDQFRAPVLGQIGRMLGPGPHLDDIAQEVFVRIFRAAGSFEQRSSLRSWIFGITHHTAVDWLRRERRTPSPDDTRLLELGHDALSQLEARDQLRALHAALDALGPDAREAFVLHEFEGLTLHEIADRLGVPLFTIAARVRRAREAMAIRLDRAASTALPSATSSSLAADHLQTPRVAHSAAPGKKS